VTLWSDSLCNATQSWNKAILVTWTKLEVHPPLLTVNHTVVGRATRLLTARLQLIVVPELGANAPSTVQTHLVRCILQVHLAGVVIMHQDLHDPVVCGLACIHMCVHPAPQTAC
jgi:hypothetical protein